MTTPETMQTTFKRQDSYGSAVREPKSFGKRREHATITITRAGRERHFTIRPIFLSFAVSLVAMFLVGYLGATAYLVFRDDLIGASQTRNARLMHEYEDRIAALRANLDRVTSRQLLDQQAIEARIEELMQRQEMLRDRSSRIGSLLDKAHERGLTPEARSEAKQDQAALRGARTDPITTASVARPAAPIRVAGGISLRGGHDMVAQVQAVPDITNLAATETIFSSVAARIDALEQGQRTVLDDIRTAAAERTTHIAKVLKKLKVSLPMESDVGGPFIAAPETARAIPFEAHVDALDGSLGRLDRMTARLASVPVANPAPGRRVTSNFGTRIDPFLGRAALHSGIDFSAPVGLPVKATASGTVIDAGRNGGYGNMVEIDHGDGITTRYAHLSRIKVESGQKVERGTVIGLAGSTGRSTGPHVHYEVRRKGTAVNPARYLKAGRELAGLL